MLGIGGTELFIILVFAFLVFGPDKMPQIGRTLGRAIRQFRNAQEEMNRVVRQEVYDPLNDDEPLGDSLKGIFKEFTGEQDKSPQVKPVSSTSLTSESLTDCKEGNDSKDHHNVKNPDQVSQSHADAQSGSVSSDADCTVASSASSEVQKSSEHDTQVVVKKPVQGETFAQKKARLAREKAERERAQRASDSSLDVRGGE